MCIDTYFDNKVDEMQIFFHNGRVFVLKKIWLFDGSIAQKKKEQDTISCNHPSPSLMYF
jgi:hypothetical protein